MAKIFYRDMNDLVCMTNIIKGIGGWGMKFFCSYHFFPFLLSEIHSTLLVLVPYFNSRASDLQNSDVNPNITP